MVKAAQQGFTLLELMVVIGIIGVLVAIAYPSYQDAVRRSNRADVQTVLVQITQALERYRNQNLTYAPSTPYPSAPTLDTTMLPEGYIYGGLTYPISNNSGRVLYDLQYVVTGGGTGYLLSASPRNGNTQASDGLLVIDQFGRKCWSKKDLSCTAANNTGTGWTY